MLGKELTQRLRVGIVGCGAIGEGLALFIDSQLSDKINLCALADKDKQRAVKLQKKLQSVLSVVGVEELIKKVDLVVETASIEAARFILKRALLYKKDMLILSAGALIENFPLLARAKKAKINIYVPSGAISGIDGLGALSLGSIRKVSLITSKPPRGLIGADYLKRKRINLTNLKREKVVFKGSVKEAVRYFPKNINVAAILVLASSSQNVEVCIKANPNLKRNTHCIIVEAKEAKLSITVENTPSKLNPRTSSLAILSVQYFFKKMFSNFKVGS